MEEKQKNVSQKIKEIIAKIKENTATTAYELTTITEGVPDIFDSKFGGVPYWDMAKEYPVDSIGEKMMLLAQINFTKEALGDERLPEQGMLQFFIASEHDVFGVDFDETDSQKDFRVIYHETLDASCTKEQVLALEIPIADEENECSPILREMAVKITKKTTWLGSRDYRFDKIYAQAWKEVSNEDLGNKSFYHSVSDEDCDYLDEELSNDGHWILGYPYFTQSDPREGQKDPYYDTLLLQMDTECVDHAYSIIWGDCGVANFFINGEALKNKDFSKVMYTWDCC